MAHLNIEFYGKAGEVFRKPLVVLEQVEESCRFLAVHNFEMAGCHMFVLKRLFIPMSVFTSNLGELASDCSPV